MLAACWREELAPARPGAPRRRLQSRCRRSRRTVLGETRDAELQQLAGDPRIAPARVLARQAQDELTTRRSTGGRPGDRCDCVHLRRTSSRCQRSSVCGVTIILPASRWEDPSQAPRGRHDRPAGKRGAVAADGAPQAGAAEQQFDVLGELAAPAPTSNRSRPRPRRRCRVCRSTPDVAAITVTNGCARGVRSGRCVRSPDRSRCKQRLQRTRANRGERAPTFAVKKVEGSSPFIRFKNPRKSGFLFT